MAATGQRIHPAGSRHPDPHARRPPARASMRAGSTTPAASASWPARRGRARMRSSSMALEAVARVAHRGAASTDNSGDGAGLLTQIPYRLFYRDAYRLGLHLQPGLPFGVGAFFLPREPQALGESVRMIETVLAEDGIPFLGWRDVPVNAAALGPTALDVVPGDPAGAGGASGAGGGRGGVGARTLPGETRDGATGGRSEISPGSTSAPSPAAPSSTRPCSPGLSSPPSSPTSATPSTRARSRSSISATRPTPCRAGRWRSPSGSSRTTARSIPSGATATR